MLYSESGQNGSKDFHTLTTSRTIFPCLLFVLVIFSFLTATSCGGKNDPNKDFDSTYYDTLRVGGHAISLQQIRKVVAHLSENDKAICQADWFVRTYYQGADSLVWLNHTGLNPCASSVLAQLETVGEMGFSPTRFGTAEIAEDLRRVKTVDFDKGKNEPAKVFARLEYHLTKAYLRYVTGQNFGFVNPKNMYNRLDIKDSDSVKVTYNTLFDIKTASPDKRFYQQAFHKVQCDSAVSFMRESEPRNPLYRRLKEDLHGELARRYGKDKILVNMERCRWQLPDEPYAHNRYILVNIPSFHLLAKDRNDILTMRMGCGSTKTKTPLIVSRITRIDINPQWIVPKSIVKKSIANHLGNPSWFASHRYFIREKSTGRDVQPENATREMLLSNDYMVIQQGGAGNSLGRIIFRFDNNLSIFLHDTPNRQIFSQTDRNVSHGCIRLEKPFELATFLTGHDKNTVERIGYSIKADVSSLGSHAQSSESNTPAKADTLNRKKLIGKVTVEPSVPIFILYYTIYPNAQGEMEPFNDVYGYDAPILKRIRNFM